MNNLTWKRIEKLLNKKQEVKKEPSYQQRLIDMGFDELKVAQQIVKILLDYDLRVNHAHEVLEIADNLIDSATSIKTGAVYSDKKE